MPTFPRDDLSDEMHDECERLQRRLDAAMRVVEAARQEVSYLTVRDHWKLHDALAAFDETGEKR